MDVDHDIGNFSQEDWDGICSTLSEPKAVSRDQWLQTIDALTAENSSLGLEKRSGEVSLKIAEENGAGATPLDSVAATSSSSISTGSSQANSLVSQQLRGNPARYVFEIAKKRYFEFSSEPPAKVNLVPSKFQKGVCCDFPPDYKCKSGAFPVITTCKSVPRDGFCGRCGSLGSHACRTEPLEKCSYKICGLYWQRKYLLTGIFRNYKFGMIHCQACCDPFHHFCAHLPKALVLRLTAWYCHRCAICSLCGGKEADGKSFVADVIETCYRCHKQFHIHCNSSSNFMLFNRNSEREITLCNCCFSRSSCRICRLPLSGSDYYRDFLDVSSAPCTVCRNAEERDMCRSCYSTKLSPDSSNDLRKVSCKRCCAVYHRKCVNFSGLDQQDFFCSKCSSAVHAAPKEVWTVTSGRVIIEKLRKLIMTVLNVEYRKRSSRLSMESQKYHELERHPAHESASIQSTLPRRSSKIVTVEQLVTSREHAVENSDPNSTFENSMVPVYGIYATIVNRIGDAHADEFWVGTSPDSGVPRCDSGGMWVQAAYLITSGFEHAQDIDTFAF